MNGVLICGVLSLSLGSNRIDNYFSELRLNGYLILKRAHGLNEVITVQLDSSTVVWRVKNADTSGTCAGFAVYAQNRILQLLAADKATALAWIFALEVVVGARSPAVEGKKRRTSSQICDISPGIALLLSPSIIMTFILVDGGCHTFSTKGVQFTIPNTYFPVKAVGYGSSGLVISAIHTSGFGKVVLEGLHLDQDPEEFSKGLEESISQLYKASIAVPTKEIQLAKVTSTEGFFVALDQGGQAAKEALQKYGIPDSELGDDKAVQDFTIKMRERMMANDGLTGSQALAVTLTSEMLSHKIRDRPGHDISRAATFFGREDDAVGNPHRIQI